MAMLRQSTDFAAVWAFAASFWVEVSAASLGTLGWLAHWYEWRFACAEMMNSQCLLKCFCFDSVQELGIWFQQTSLSEVGDIFRKGEGDRAICCPTLVSLLHDRTIVTVVIMPY